MKNRRRIGTGEFLVLSGELVLEFAGLVQFVVEADDLGGFVAVVALGGVVEAGHLVQFALQVRVDAFHLLAALLHVAGQRVRLWGDENVYRQSIVVLLCWCNADDVVAFS